MDIGFLKLFAAYGLPMVGWLIGGQILLMSDRFIIGAFRGSTEVGIYSANHALIATGLGLVLNPILIAAQPIIMSAWERGDRERIGPLIGIFSRYYIIAIVPLVALVSVFKREIVGVMLGEDFHEGYTIVPFLLAGIAVWGLSIFAHKGFEIVERTTALFRWVMVSVVLNVALNLIFVPRFGYQAAAVTSLVSYFSYLLLIHRATRVVIPWQIPRATILRTLAAALVASTLLEALRLALAPRAPTLVVLIVGFLVGSILYILLLVLMKELRSHELRVITPRRGTPQSSVDE
jgi:O-antigen/teichoic acid export membrane protein